jgi:hypothetical protein
MIRRSGSMRSRNPWKQPSETMPWGGSR